MVGLWAGQGPIWQLAKTAALASPVDISDVQCIWVNGNVSMNLFDGKKQETLSAKRLEFVANLSWTFRSAQLRITLTGKRTNLR